MGLILVQLTSPTNIDDITLQNGAEWTLVRQRSQQSSVRSYYLAMAATTMKLLLSPPWLLLLLISSLIPITLAYKPGDTVPMSRMGQYHSVRPLNFSFRNSSLHYCSFHSHTMPFHLFFFQIAVENRVAGPHWPPLPHLRSESWGSRVLVL